MSWIICRSKADDFEIYRDIYQVNGVHGVWKDGGGLPLQYAERWRALQKMYEFAGKDPEWQYEVREYLR